MKRAEYLFLLLIVVLAACLRLDYLLADQSVIDSDEAIVGLMARHFLAGSSMPVFYYGQHYMGSLEAYMAALLFSVFGESSFILRVTPLIFSLATIPFLYLLVKKVADTQAAFIAAVLYAVAPPVLLTWSSKARGGFVEILFLGTVAYFFAAKWYLSNKPAKKDVFWVAFILGVGWWTNTQILYFLCPLGLLFLVRWMFDIQLPNGRLRYLEFLFQFCTGLVAFILGSLPFWIYNAYNSFASFGIASAVGLQETFEHFFGLVTISLPIIFGAVRFWEQDQLYPWAKEGVWVVCILLLLYWVALFFSQLRTSGSQPRKEHVVVLFGVTIIGIIAIFCLSSFGYLVQAPRYLLPLYIPFYALLSVAVSRLAVIHRSLPVLCCMFLLLWNIVAAYGTGRAISGQPFVYDAERVAKDHRELHLWLEKNNIKAVRTNYWIGYRLAFETKERVIFQVFAEPDQVRIPEYESTVREYIRRGIDVPYVLLPKQAKVVAVGLSAAGYNFQQTNVGNYVVIHDLQRHVFLQQIYPEVRVRASDNSDAVTYVMDQDLDTRWGSGKPATRGMFIDLEFDSHQNELRGLEFLLGSWKHDYGRSMRVIAHGAQGEREVVLNAAAYEALRYLDCVDVKFQFNTAFPITKIRIELLQGHSIFDWSLADIVFFGEH